MKPKILFLDDNPRRHYSFKCAICWNYSAVETTKETIDNLSAGEWDFVFLDHDLGGEHFVDTSREDCGMEVIRWIEAQENKPKVDKFVVHSHNTDAAIIMVQKLLDMGYDAEYVPFCNLIGTLSRIIVFEDWIKKSDG